MLEKPIADLEKWIAEPLSSAVAKSIARLRAAEGVKKVCVMPDVHLSKEVCIGAVVATEGVVYPQAVGGDIGCGMAALRFELEATALDNNRAAGDVLAGLYQAVPSNKHRHVRQFPEALQPNDLSDRKLAKLALRDGAVQLGALGRGNHFLEFQADQQGQLWVMLHSGSRAIGQAIFAHHLSRGVKVSVGAIGLEAAEESGKAFMQDVIWARSYAMHNRLAMLQAAGLVIKKLFRAEADWDSLIHADHNHVQQELHGGKTLYVHRKGAQSAKTGETGVIPGSMGSVSFHTEGRGCTASLTSCSHGAGRRLSRSEARRAITPTEFQRQVGSLWYDHRRADRFRDESPGAYKDIRMVMRAQRKLVRVVRELQPVLGYKGS